MMSERNTDVSIEMGHLRDLLDLSEKVAQVIDSDCRIKDKTIQDGLNFLGAILVDAMEQIAALAKQLN